MDFTIEVDCRERQAGPQPSPGSSPGKTQPCGNGRIQDHLSYSDGSRRPVLQAVLPSVIRQHRFFAVDG